MSQPASNAPTLQALSDEYRASLAAIPADQARREFEDTWVDDSGPADPWPNQIEVVPEILVPDEPPVEPVVVEPDTKPARPRVVRAK